MTKRQYQWLFKSLLREHDKGRLDEIQTVDEYVDYLEEVSNGTDQ